MVDEHEELRWWQERYTPFIEQFLAKELTDHERRQMPDAFTALHEQMGHVFATWMSTATVTDRSAWEQFDPLRHLLDGSHITLLPADVDVLTFVPLFVRFVEYLGRMGAVPETAAARIAAAYPEAAREVERIDAEMQDQISIVPGNGNAHTIIPLPCASAESRERVKKTSYLVERFLRSRHGKHLEPSFASMGVHLLVAEHAEEHGHRDWAKLDVPRMVATLTTNGFIAPSIVPMFVDAWHGFLDWLVDRGRLPASDAARLHEAVAAAGLALARVPMPWAS